MSVRKKTKHTLSNEYQIVFETTGKAMVIVEEDATISLANAEFEKLSGYTKKEIEGKKSWTEFVTRDDRKRVREYHRLRKTDPMLAPRSFEFRFLDRHETVKNVVLTIGQIPGTNKSMASLLDITDRRRDEKQARGAHTASEERLESKTAELIEANEALEAEVADLKRKVKKLEESEKLYRNLAENVDFGINLIDADYNIMMINSAQTRNFKKTNDQIIGGKCYQEFEKRDTVCPHCPGVQTMATGQPAEAETEGIRDDGSRFHVRIQTFPVFGQDGTTNGFIEVVEDITNRTQTEEALRESEERFRRLIETTKVGVSAIDEKGVITYANNRFCEIWGYSVDEIMGRPVFDFLDEENRKILKENLAKRKKGGSDSYEISWTRKHGSKVPTILSPTPRFDADGQFIGSYGFITDISERKRTEDALKESEGRFKMLAENAPFAISVMTPDRTFEYFNPLFTELFGYTKEDLPDKDTWFKKAYPDEEYRKKVASTWKRDIAEDVNGGERGLRVFTVRCKDGQDKIISFKIVYLNDGKQYLTYRDITARVKAEETLQESEERYRTLVENIKLGISLIDSDYNVIMVNAALSKRLKKQAGEMIGKKCYREFLNRDSICPNCPGVQAMATGKSAEDKMEGVRDDGRPFYMRLQAFPVFGQDGTTNGFIEVVEDITKRKQMEEALRESEERFRRLIETTKVGVSAIDEKGVITYANNRFGEIWGYSVDEIMGRHVFDFLDEDNRKTLKEHLAKRKQGEADSYEITWTRKDGGKVPTILSPTPNFDADGRYKGSYGFITDITERKRMEERLQRYAAELERSNEEVKNFAYIVSHDLRVPLVNLKGYSTELQSALEVIGPNMETALPHLEEEKRSAVAMALHEDVPEALEFITTSVSRMDSFINSVLQLSRLGRRELKPEPLDMNALVQTSLKNLAHQIQERGIEVTVGSLPQVVADRTAMEQIMGNILGNAVKYLDPERPGQIEVTAETNNGEQIFRIHDNGRGIADEDMHKVFAPFRRAGKQDKPGEGMGLAYVQTLVRRHNGRIWCESELGKGTTMTFTTSPQRAAGGDHVAH
jgi:PAS domain S-box-containing protein